MSNYLEKAFSPAKLGSLKLKNRIIKAATYEGKTSDGIPGDLLLDFHKAIVEGGTAMTTIGYCTTEADGRINDQMMFRNYPYHELYFLEDAKRIRDRVNCQMVYIGGCTAVGQSGECNEGRFRLRATGPPTD